MLLAYYLIEPQCRFSQPGAEDQGPRPKADFADFRNNFALHSGDSYCVITHTSHRLHRQPGWAGNWRRKLNTALSITWSRALRPLYGRRRFYIIWWTSPASAALISPKYSWNCHSITRWRCHKATLVVSRHLTSRPVVGYWKWLRKKQQKRPLPALARRRACGRARGHATNEWHDGLVRDMDIRRVIAFHQFSALTRNSWCLKSAKMLPMLLLNSSFIYNVFLI